MKFRVELLEKAYEVEAAHWQQAKWVAARLYRGETGRRYSTAFLVALARAGKLEGGRSPRVVSLRGLELEGESESSAAIQ